MNSDIGPILHFIENVSQKDSAYIQNAEKLLLKDNENLNFYEYIINNYDEPFEITVGPQNITRNEGVIVLLIQGHHKAIGTIINYGTALINEKTFDITNIVNIAHNPKLKNDYIDIIYIPSKGLYQIQSINLRSNNTFMAKIILIYAFPKEPYEYKQTSIEHKIQNEFNINLLDRADSPEINHLNIKEFNYSTPCSYFKYNNSLLDAHTLISTNIHNFKFISYPTLKKDNQGIWSMTITYKLYIFSKDLNELLNFIENNHKILKDPFLFNFYKATSDFINKLYNTTQIEINEKTNMNEVRKIVKTLEY